MIDKPTILELPDLLLYHEILNPFTPAPLDSSESIEVLESNTGSCRPARSERDLLLEQPCVVAELQVPASVTVVVLAVLSPVTMLPRVEPRVGRHDLDRRLFHEVIGLALIEIVESKLVDSFFCKRITIAALLWISEGMLLGIRDSAGVHPAFPERQDRAFG